MKTFTPLQQLLFLLIAAVAVIGHHVASQRNPGIAPPSQSTVEPAPLSHPTLREQLLMGRPIPINEATADTLRLIPGISTTLASHIVTHRHRHGPFKSWPQLENVHGLGPKTLEKLRPYVRLDGTAGDCAAEPMRLEDTSAAEPMRLENSAGIEEFGN